MAETRTYNGYTYSRNSAGEPWQLVGPAQQQPQSITIGRPDPYKATAEQRANEDQGFQARSVANSERATALAEQRFQADLEARMREEERKRNPSITAQQRIDLEAKRGTLANLASGISSLKEQYNANFKGRSAAEYLPAIARPENGVFNDKSGSLSAYVAAALGLSGQQFNTPAEQQLFIGSILPKAGDTDQQIEAKLGTLEELLRNADNTSASQLGVKPSYQGGQEVSNNGGGGSTGGTRGYENDPSGGRTFQTDVDRAYQNEAEQAFKSGASREQLDAIARKYGAPAFGPDLDQAIQARQANPNAPIGFTTPASGREEAGLTGALLGPIADSSVGSYFTGAGNAVTAGNLGNLAELTGSSQGGTDLAMQMAQENGPAYFGGEVTGGILGALGAQRGLGALSRFLPAGAAANAVASPLAADAAYGAAVGASSADDPLYGAVGGGLLGLGGGYLGGKIGGAIGGARRPHNVSPLNAGQSQLMGAVNETGVDNVTAALLRAQELGVPATLADVSPSVEALTGSALRANPALAGQARDMLGQRSAGQIDRFRGAVSRDLGPIENIPQRSEDLIAQARTSAAPLYDELYAAPGADQAYDQIADLLARPSMQSAQSRARVLAAEEGLSPADGSWQSLDYIKRGLDDVVQANRSANMGSLDNAGRLTNNTLQDFLSRVDPVSGGAFPAARNAYAGPMQERAFLEAGQDAVRANPNQLGVDMQGLTPQRAEQMQMGFRSKLIDDAERLRNSSNPFDSLNTPAMERRLGAVYGGDNVARLLAQRDLERGLASSANRLVGNSATAERAAADAAFGDSGAMRPIIEGGIETAISGAPAMTILRSLANSSVGQKLTEGARRRASERAESIVPTALNDNAGDTIAQILSLARNAEEYETAKALLREMGVAPGRLVGASSAAGAIPFLAGN